MKYLSFQQSIALIALLGFFFLSLVAYGQSLQDIQNLKVDDLSDAQIEQMIRRAEASGMNESQLAAMARERGMPPEELSKLQRRMETLRTGGRAAEPGTKVQSMPGQRRIEGFEYDQDIFDSLRKRDPYYDLTPKQKKIFGFTLFHNRQLDFSPSLNLPTPQQYVLGAGDQLLVDIYGASQQSYDLTVTPEGKVLFPNVGPVEVGGSTVEVATNRIRNSLRTIYSGLGGENPNTFMQLRVGNIRTIKVTLAGELRRPGSYELPSFSTIFNALYVAGGPNENGTFREIQVYRDNKMISELDIYDFLVGGDQSKNLVLRDNDVIIVGPVKTRVELEGPVRRPGFFEIRSSESVEDLLKFAGGFTSQAYKAMITVRRAMDKEMKVDNVYAEQFTNFPIQDGDVFRVGEILARYENRVQVSGAVFRPGQFALLPDMTLSELVKRADGLRGDAFTGRATLYRTKENLTMEILSVDITGILEGQVEDIPLRREDILNIPSIYDIKEEYYVQISGEVNRTGVYQFGENMTVGDLVVKSKGFKESATSSSIEIIRRVKGDSSGKIAEVIMADVDTNLALSEEDRAITLQPFDHVFVRKSPGFQREKIVRVEGQVFYPGEFALEKNNERISDVLRRAGGTNQFAYPKGATLIRRTEFYDTPEEEELKLKNLESLLQNLDRDTTVANAESEEQLLLRLQKRVELLQYERRKNEEEYTEQRSFAEDRYSLLEGTDTSAVMDIAFRDKELIGIDLDQIIANPGSKYDLILEEGDVLSIPKELQTVRMRGEVLYPTTARYDEFRGFRNYISRAGGYTEESRRGRSYVIYANGDVKRTSKFLFFNFYPSIEPGAEIVVPRRRPRQPLQAQALVGMASTITTLFLLITR
ncbi:SLBB domain-containing protein [Pleomorphovibrio marinus]|uniref:SLBB domain-containing protein n=1 Tax=Pleomorphovibrio marinus TaxID=2164132 RepID=UPI000E0ADB86|nr:SLBB domain-containing protein [Pleomorphovibrio marinus]